MTIPCINCICLPICKSRIDQIKKSNKYLVYELSENCSLLKEYIISDQTIHPSDLKAVYNFFITGTI